MTRVRLRNYRGIAACDVRLGPLTFLVGRNGAGKSNFLDALRFVADSLRTSLDYALRERGGVNEVRRRSSGHPNHFGIRIDFTIQDGSPGFFAFEIGARSGGGYVVQTERCVVGKHVYLVEEGVLRKPPADVSPPTADDRLYLVNAAGLPSFRPAFDLLSNMGFYNVNPDRIRAVQPADKGDLLARDGVNLASVLERLKNSNGGAPKTRIVEYLAEVVPGIVDVERIAVGHMETLEFRQRVQGAAEPWRFSAINTSDGTLRALGVLCAVFQSRADGRIPLIGIEEPEAALHPLAAGILRDALRDAARQVQVVVTSHSPDLLDDPEVSAAEILSVAKRDGTTEIGTLDEAGRSALQDHLYTAGELLRVDQLVPDPSSIPEASQLNLFDPTPS